MTNKEAIRRIREHMIIHKLNEPRAIYINEALEMAVKALEEQMRCGNCIHNGEKSVTGNCIKCKDFDRYER